MSSFTTPLKSALPAGTTVSPEGTTVNAPPEVTEENSYQGKVSFSTDATILVQILGLLEPPSHEDAFAALTE